jgi:hypothetical protein
VPKFVDVAAELTYESAEGTTLTVEAADTLARLEATIVTNVAIEAIATRIGGRPGPRY